MCVREGGREREREREMEGGRENACLQKSRKCSYTLETRGYSLQGVERMRPFIKYTPYHFRQWLLH